MNELPRVVMLPILRPGTCFTSTPPRSVFELAIHALLRRRRARQRA